MPKITALTENTNPATTDIIYIVDDPGGTPVSQKVTLANIKALVNDITTDAEWDAKGDLVVGTGANTADRLAVGAHNTVLMADSGAATGLKWSASPVVVDTVWDAKGDLVGGTGANTAARLAIGTNGYVLTADSGETTGMKWVARDIGCRIYNDATQGIAHNTVVTLAFNSEVYDTDTMHDNSTNNSRITINTAGKYLLEFHGVFNSAFASASDAGAWIEHSTRGRLVQSNIIYLTTSNNPTISLVTIVDLAVSDYVIVKVFQTTGSTETLVAGAGGNEYSQYFAAQKIN